MHGRSAKTFAATARFSLKHQRVITIAAVLVALLSAYIAFPPKIDSNLLNLLPSSNPSVAALQRINREDGGLNLYTLTYTSDNPKALDTFLDKLAADFRALDDVEFAIHSIDPNLMKQVALLQLKPNELAQLNVRLQGALALGPAINPIVTQKLMDMGPLTQRIGKLTGPSQLVGPDNGTGRLIIRPTQASTNPAFAIRFKNTADKILQASHPEQAGVKLLWQGGAYYHTPRDIEGIQRDLSTTSTVSFGLVLLIMVIAFRSWKAMFIVFPPLILANLINLALIDLTAGSLNTYTSFGTAILFGLGTDFSIHLIGRFRELRASGLAKEDAIAEAWARTGPPCLTATNTAVVAFVALATAQFDGFSQLGTALAVGLLLSLLCSIVLLPILINKLDHETRPLLGGNSIITVSTSTYRYSLAGAIVLIVATIGVGAKVLPHMPFEYDVSAMRPEGESYAELSTAERELARESYAPVVVTIKGDIHTLVQAQAHARSLMAQGKMPHVAAAISVADMLPPDQAERNEQIRHLVDLLDNPSLRYLPPAIVKPLLALRGLEVKDLSIQDVPASMSLLLGLKHADQGQYRLLLLPKGNMWDVREATKLSQEIHAAFPSAEIAGTYIGVAAMYQLALGDTVWIVGFALLLVTFFTWWDLRSPLYTLVAMGALVTGLIWAAGALYLFDIKLSMVNISGIPILLGIGIDVVIHLLHRLQEEGPGGVRRAFRTTGVASMVSTLTEIASFVALIMATNRGIADLGWLVAIGLTCVTVVGAILLPLLWSAGWKLKGLAPADNLPTPQT